MAGLETGGRRGVGSWRVTVGLSLACAAIYVAISLYNFAPHTYLMGDCRYYAATAVSLIADGDLKVENNLKGGLERHAGFVSLGADGEWRPKHPILMPVVSVPFLIVFGVKGLLILNLLVMTLLVAATHRLALRGASVVPATAATAVTCLLTFVIAYAYNYSPDAFAALPAIVALILFLDDRYLAAGFLGGVAFLAKPAHLLLLVTVAAAAWFFGGRRPAIRFTAGVLPAIALVLIYNALLFGGALTFSYDRMLADDSGAVVSQRDDFSLGSMPANLAGQFVHPEKGLMLTAPSALFAMVGLRRLWRRRQRLAVVPLAVAATYLLFFSAFAPWMASHFGNRFLFVPVLASALPLAALFDGKWLRRIGLGAKTVHPEGAGA